MSNTKLIAPSAKHSSRVQRRRKLFSLKRTIISPATFIKLYGGHFQMKRDNGVFYCHFQSGDKRSYACGNSFERAYRRCLMIFHERYLDAIITDYLNSKIFA